MHTNSLYSALQTILSMYLYLTASATSTHCSAKEAYILSGHPSGESSLCPPITMDSMTVFPSSLYGSSPVYMNMCEQSKEIVL